MFITTFTLNLFLRKKVRENWECPKEWALIDYKATKTRRHKGFLAASLAPPATLAPRCTRCSAVGQVCGFVPSWLAHKIRHSQKIRVRHLSLSLWYDKLNFYRK
jgi:hypothetical protein